MSEFDRSPQPQQPPKYTPEKLAEYLSDVDGALIIDIKVLMRGFEESSGVYKPWPKAEVEKSLNSILVMFEQKVKLYQGAGNSEKAKKASEEVEGLKRLFSTLNNSQAVPKDFLQTVQQVMEGKINISDALRNALNATTPPERIIEN